jgi:hypothetical protein
MQGLNEPIAACMIGLLLAVSAGVRVTLPLLAVNLMAYNHVIALPANLSWLGSQPTLILLCVAGVAETIVYFIPVAGTYLKAVATPLAFAGGTVLMAVPLHDHNPIYQWTLAAVLGGGAATITDLGLTGARAMTAPLNAASAGIFGILWNIGEFLLSLLLVVVGAICVFAGAVVALLALIAIAALFLFLVVKTYRHFRKPRAPHVTANEVVVSP